MEHAIGSGWGAVGAALGQGLWVLMGRATYAGPLILLGYVRSSRFRWSDVDPGST